MLFPKLVAILVVVKTMNVAAARTMIAAAKKTIRNHVVVQASRKKIKNPAVAVQANNRKNLQQKKLQRKKQQKKKLNNRYSQIKIWDF
jgi:hypothetical protein